MGQLIDFDAYRKQNMVTDPFDVADAEFEAAAERFKESGGKEGLPEFLHAMGALAASALDGLDVQAMVEWEKKKREEFLKRNQEIIKNEPKFDAGLRMQYYAGVLLGLVDKVFHTEDGFSQPFDDFADFWNLFDIAFSEYIHQYPELEEKYHFSGELTYDVVKLEQKVMECLQETVRLRPNESDRNKTRLLYCGSWLFEVYRNMLYYSSEKAGL